MSINAYTHETLKIERTITNEAGQSVDLNDATIVFALKHRKAGATVQLKEVSVEGNVVTATVDPSDIALPGNYDWELRISISGEEDRLDGDVISVTQSLHHIVS
jgi:hypothetical protein